MKRILAALYLLLPMLTYANVYTVTSTTDGNATNQLRGAIAAADAAGGTNTINISAGSYTLTLGAISFGNRAMSLSIIGAGSGSTIINMSTTGQDRIFFINPPGTVSGVNVTIQGLTFQNGKLTGDAFGGGAILCGGPLNTVNLTSCVFSSNSTNSSLTGGGAVAMEGGGALAIDQCSFLNNVSPSGNGGALFYFGPSAVSGSLSITNSIFSGNTATTGSAEGGALYITVQGTAAGVTSAISVQKNTFTGNKAVGASSTAGAIGVNNGVAGNTVLINYNRFFGNTATSIADVGMNSASGNVDVSNNWWGSNASPLAAGDVHAGMITTGGAGVLTATPWLRLSCGSSVSAAGVCAGSGGNTAVVTAGFLTNSAGTGVSAANLTALTGVPVSFSATLGTLSGAQATIQTGGTATVNFVSNGTTGTGAVQAVVDNVPANDGVAKVGIVVNAPTLAAGSTTGSVTAGGSNSIVTDASCNQICAVVPSGSQPLSGSVNARVTVDPAVASFEGQPYLTRHYDIEPTTGASTATATITLYYLQSEFNAYNAAVTGAQNMLPTGPTDNAGRSNFTITQMHGTGTAPDNYSGWAGAGPAMVLITPGQSNVVWNSVKNWWEVTFPVTGFSGFFATGPTSFPLPVVLERFGGAAQGTGVLLTWKVGVESGFSRYEVERSVDGNGYKNIGVVAGGVGAGGGEYQFFDGNAAAGNNFYRLKMVDIDGAFTYSNVVVVNIENGSGKVVQVMGNPFAGACTIRVAASVAGPFSLRLTDISGKVLWQENKIMGVGVNTFALGQTSGLAKGMYLLTVVGKQVQETVKLVKE